MSDKTTTPTQRSEAEALAHQLGIGLHETLKIAVIESALSVEWHRGRVAGARAAVELVKAMAP